LERRGVIDVLALVDDLFFRSKLTETARQVGVTVQTFTTGGTLLASMSAGPPSLIVIDLSVPQALEAVEQLHKLGNPPLVIAFLSHVQTELAERARAVGCQRVLPRSRFAAELADILRRVKQAPMGHTEA
jgi:CheY-like chemotaxis protein